MLWLWVGLPLTGLASLLAVGLRWRRYSHGHTVGQLALRGRGLYFSRTPDGIWWRLRLRARCTAGATWPEPDDPPDAGVREPLRPRGPGPLAAGEWLGPP